MEIKNARPAFIRITLIIAGLVAAITATQWLNLKSFSQNQKTNWAKAAFAADDLSPTNNEVAVLKVPYPEEPTSPSNFLVGEELGVFKKHNIQLEYPGVIPSTQLVASVVSGYIDVGGAHFNRTIAGISAGAKILAVIANSETTARFPHMIGVVKKGSKLRKPEDFVGKKIGLALNGGCHEYTPYAWLSKHGIKDPKHKVQIIILSRNALEQAVRQGELDLALLHKTPEEINRKGEFDVVFSDYDVWGTYGGATPNYFSLDFIKNNPQVVKNFTAALAETINWSNANPYRAREITARRTNYDVNLINQRFYAPDGLIQPITAEVWIDLLVEYGEIKPGVTLEQIYTNKFNPFYKEGL